MKRTVSFDEAMFNFQCPYCGSEVDWTESDYNYYWKAKCCGHKFKLVPTKARIEEENN